MIEQIEMKKLNQTEIPRGICILNLTEVARDLSKAVNNCQSYCLFVLCSHNLFIISYYLNIFITEILQKYFSVVNVNRYLPISHLQVQNNLLQ